MTTDVWLCTDCGMLTANGTGGWGLDDEGRELGDVHADRMRVWDPVGDLVVSGCAVGDECTFDHECRYDREFSSVQCAGCGTALAGFRFAAVEFVSVQR